MIAKFYYDTDETVRQKKLAELKQEKLPFVLDKLEAAANENNGHLALGRVSFSIKLFELCFHRISSIVFKENLTVLFSLDS